MLSAGPEILILITACECHNTAREEPPTSSGGSGPGVPGREEFLCNNVRVTSADNPGVSTVCHSVALSELIPVTAGLCSVVTQRLHGDTNNLSTPYLAQNKIQIFVTLFQLSGADAIHVRRGCVREFLLSYG